MFPPSIGDELAAWLTGCGSDHTGRGVEVRPPRGAWKAV